MDLCSRSYPQHQISESNTIERYLSTTHGLLSTNVLEAATLDVLSMYMWRVWHAPSPAAQASGAAAFWLEFARFLKQHDGSLQTAAEAGRGPFYGGSKPALPDLFAFTWLNRWITGWIPGPEGALTEEKYPSLWALWKGVRETSGVKEYFDSGRWSLAE